MPAYVEHFRSAHFKPRTYLAASLFTFSLPANHRVTVWRRSCVSDCVGEWKVKYFDWHSGDSCAINPSDIILSQKSWQSWGQGRRKVRVRLLSMSSNVALEKKDLGFDSWLQVVSSRYEDVLSACPSVQEHKEGAGMQNSSAHILPKGVGESGALGCLL